MSMLLSTDTIYFDNIIVAVGDKLETYFTKSF